MMKLPEDHQTMGQEEARKSLSMTHSKRDAPLLKVPNSPEHFGTRIKTVSGSTKTIAVKMKKEMN